MSEVAADGNIRLSRRQISTIVNAGGFQNRSFCLQRGAGRTGRNSATESAIRDDEAPWSR